ncbi:MAG: HvfC family RiPP maturation protein [Lysobacter sp.]
MHAPENIPPPHRASAPERLREQQFALARHLRDPLGQPAPAGIEQRRLAIYRDLLFNNIEALLAGNFPVIRKLLGHDGWVTLVRAFYRDHRCQTPLFPEIAREFLGFLEARSQQADGDPPFLGELAHYEWAELALQISEASIDDIDLEPFGDLLDGAPVLSPLAWAFAYRWPVHRLGPEYIPTIAPDAPTLLLLRRERGPDANVRFSELSPLAFRLVRQLEESPDQTGRAHLETLAKQADATDVAAFVAQGLALLEQMRASDVVLGSQRVNPLD